MNTITYSFHTRVISGPGYIWPHRAWHLLRRSCDVVNFDNFSASYHGHTRKATAMLQDDFVNRVDPATDPLQPATYNRHHSTAGKFAFN